MTISAKERELAAFIGSRVNSHIEIPLKTGAGAEA